MVTAASLVPTLNSLHLPDPANFCSDVRVLSLYKADAAVRRLEADNSTPVDLIRIGVSGHRSGCDSDQWLLIPPLQCNDLLLTREMQRRTIRGKISTVRSSSTNAARRSDMQRFQSLKRRRRDKYQHFHGGFGDAETHTQHKHQHTLV